MVERHISLLKPFASGDAVEWFQRFEICCKPNGWNAAAQALKLPTILEGETLAVSLEGEALAVSLAVTEEQQKDYETAKKEVLSAMCRPNS